MKKGDRRGVVVIALLSVGFLHDGPPTSTLPHVHTGMSSLTGARRTRRPTAQPTALAIPNDDAGTRASNSSKLDRPSIECMTCL